MPAIMLSPNLLDQQFLQMRAHCLSLAADMDRLGRAEGGLQAVAHDPRIAALGRAIAILADPTDQRARRVLEAFSDQTAQN